MRPSGVANPDGPPAGIVVRGGSPALAEAVRRLVPTAYGKAVVLVRLSPPTPASASVVHTVVDALAEAGCEVTVGSVLASRERDRGHRSVGALAHAAGLTGHTGRGRPYAVADLADDLVAAPVPPSSALAEQVVSRSWSAADTRVVIGRAVTDLVDAYAGCLDTLLRVLPEVAGCEPADVAVDVVRHLAPHLAVVDATATSGGADGNRILDAQQTDTVVVATDPLLADASLAALLGVDRSTSRLVERAIDVLGPPQGRVEGDLQPFAGVERGTPPRRPGGSSCDPGPSPRARPERRDRRPRRGVHSRPTRFSPACARSSPRRCGRRRTRSGRRPSWACSVSSAR